MKISIVTAYYNRKKLFYETLLSIARSKFKNFEFIVVDDGSEEKERIECFLNEFPFLKIIRLEPENKWYVNSCIPFNIGIKVAVGNIIVLQNPECLHVHDVLSYLNKHVNKTNYISVSTYFPTEELTNTLSKHRDNLIDYFKTFPQQHYIQPTTGKQQSGWSTHSVFREAYYHHCSAITRSNMKKLGGFDERFANGIGYDDDEIVIRIEQLGLNKIIVNDVSVIHQWHPPVYKSEQLRKKNMQLLDMLYRDYKTPKQIIPKDYVYEPEIEYEVKSRVNSSGGIETYREAKRK